MKNKLLEINSEENLFFSGCKVLCAVSGGPDSVAMLLLLLENQRQLKIGTIGCAHFNHQLRGSEADRDEIFVKELAEKLGIAYYAGCGNVSEYAKSMSISIETAARELRYRFLKNIEGYDLIATAHTADDNLETVLQHMIRGAGLHGMTGIPPKRENIVRPLLNVSREEILEYLKSKGQHFCVDSTNAEDEYQRNRIRHRIVPLLKKENSDILNIIYSNTRLLQADDEFLKCEVSQYAEEIRTEHGVLKISVKLLQELPKAIRYRLYAVLQSKLSTYRLGAKQLQLIDQIVIDGGVSNRVSVKDTAFARIYDDLSVTIQMAEESTDSMRLILDEDICFGNWIIHASMVDSEQYQKQTISKFYLNGDIIESPIYIRSRRKGDKIHLLKGNGTALLSDLMINKKIPKMQRDKIPVITDDNQIIAVGGMGMSADFQPIKTGRLLEIKIIEKGMNNDE